MGKDYSEVIGCLNTYILTHTYTHIHPPTHTHTHTYTLQTRQAEHTDHANE